MNITHINRKKVASALGATVVAAAVPALLFGGAGAAQAAPPAPTAIQSLPQVRPGDLPGDLPPCDAVPAHTRCHAPFWTPTNCQAQNTLNTLSDQYGAAVTEQRNAQEAYDFDRKGPFWNSTRAPAGSSASGTQDGGSVNSAGLPGTVGQYDTERLNNANQRVADLQPKVKAAIPAAHACYPQ